MLKTVLLEVATEPIKKRSTEPKYSVELEFMHGYADSYSSETIIFEDTSSEGIAFLKNFISICHSVLNLNARNWSDLREMEGWSAFFNEDCPDEEVHKYNPDNVYIDWPGDATSLNEYPSQLTMIYVQYVNKYGEVFPVTVTTTD